MVFARAAFGENVSFLVGWVAYVSALFSSSAVIVGLTRAVLSGLGASSGPLAQAAPALVVALLAAVVASGLRLSARVWTSLTALKLLPLVLLVLAFAAFGRGLAAPAAAAPDAGWLRAALTVVFACQGFEIVPVIAGQVRASARAVPLATIGSLALAVALYVLLVLACVSALPGLASSQAPLADTAGALAGPGLASLVAAGTSVSALGIAFGMMVTTPRYLSALAAGERSLFGLDRMSPRGVPLRALAVTWVVDSIVVSLGELRELFALSSIAVLAQFGTSALALLVLAARRERRARSARRLAGAADPRGRGAAGGARRDAEGGARRARHARGRRRAARARAAAGARSRALTHAARRDLALSGEVDGRGAAGLGRATA